MPRRLSVSRDLLRPERVYLAEREAAIVAGVGVNWLQGQVAGGKLASWLVDRQGRDGRRYHLYRLDEVLALKALKRR